MDFTLILGIFLFTIVMIKLFDKVKEKQGNLAPMPWKLPIVGHLFFLDPKKPYETVANWGKKFGSVFRLFFGGDEILVLNDYATIKEAFSKQGDVFSGRPTLFLFQQLQEGGKRGIVLAEGARWKEHRRFSLSRLRDLGLGKSLLDEKIQAEIDVMLSEVDEKLLSKPTSIDLVLEVKFCIANIISSVVFGHRFPAGDPDYMQFQHNMDESMQIIGLAGFLTAFPVLRYLVPGGLGFWRLMKSREEVHWFYIKQIDDHLAKIKQKESFEEVDSDDFTTAYLKEMLKHEKSGQDLGFNTHQLQYVVGDLFFAGQETTVTTLRWAILFLVKNPEIQERMFQEIKENVGRMPSQKDRSMLPFCNAVVLESQRLGNIIPFGVFHATVEPTHLNGFYIPKGITVLPNLWAVHMDPEIFPEPNKFRPSRFLDSSGTKLNNASDNIMPFSIGKRVCLGESLAKAELFLTLTALVWRYKMSVPEGQSPSTDPVLGFTIAPEKYEVSIEKRMDT